MNISKRLSRLKLQNALATFVVLAVFLFPILLTVQWAQGVFGLDDGRNTLQLESFNSRPFDQNKQNLSPFNEPIISVTFDDGWESAYSTALPIMQKYGIHSTQYILTGSFNDVNYLSEDQVRSFASYGHEIGSHTVTHPDLTKLSDNDLTNELTGSKNTIMETFKTVPLDFATPLGEGDERVKSQIQKDYRSNRNTKGDLNPVGIEDVNTVANFNRYDINAYTVRQTTTLEELQNFISYAQKTNAWIVITYHQVDDSGAAYGVSPAVFEQQMKLLYDAKIRSAPVGQVLNAMEGKIDAPSF